MEKKPVSYFLVGIILGMISIVVFLLYYFTGMYLQRNFLSYLPSLISIGLITYFVVQYSNANNNNLTFGNLFGYGFRSTMIWALIVFAFTFISLYFLFPEMKDKAIEAARMEMEKQGKLSEDQQTTAIAFVEKGFNAIALGSGLFMNLLTGVIGSLIGAGVAKKRPSNPFEQSSYNQPV